MGADGDAESLRIWGNLGLLALTFAAEGHWMALLRLLIYSIALGSQRCGGLTCQAINMPCEGGLGQETQPGTEVLRKTPSDSCHPL